MKKLIILLFFFLQININLICKEVQKYIIITTLGDIEISLFPEVAPQNIKNFKYLVNSNFYSETYVHRVVSNFMIQCGDPNTKDEDRTNDGKGGTGYFIKDEINADTFGLDTLKVRDSYITGMFPKDSSYQTLTVKTVYEKLGYNFDCNLESLPHRYGAISLANSGANSNSSQFFIVTNPSGTSWLNGKHTVIGVVTDGMDIVKKIEKVQVDKFNNPLLENQIVIEKIIPILDKE